MVGNVFQMYSALKFIMNVICTFDGTEENHIKEPAAPKSFKFCNTKINVKCITS
jgi:hypothetical protein